MPATLSTKVKYLIPYTNVYWNIIRLEYYKLSWQGYILQRRIQNPCQISKMKLFAKIVNCWKVLTIFAKISISDVWLGSEYASVLEYS